MVGNIASYHAYSPSPARSPSSAPVPAVRWLLAWTATRGVSGPAVDQPRAPPRGSPDEEGSLTTSIAEPAHPLSHHPVLRRLVDILPPAAPATPACAPIPGPPATDPTACAHAERVLRAAVEILGGRRPVHQLSAVLRPELLARLTALQQVVGHLRPQVHKVLASPQGPGVTEAVAVVRLSTGIRALAARFEERTDGGGHRWQCTALQLRLTPGDLATRERPRRATR